MTTPIIPAGFFNFSPSNSNRMYPDWFGALGVVRLPTDPLYYADLVLDNIVSGSRYRVTRDSTGDELATGSAGSTSVTLTDIPAYDNPMLCRIEIRNASGATKYKPFTAYAYLYRTGGSAYILQQVD